MSRFPRSDSRPSAGMQAKPAQSRTASVSPQPSRLSRRRPEKGPSESDAAGRGCALPTPRHSRLRSRGADSRSPAGQFSGWEPSNAREAAPLAAQFLAWFADSGRQDGGGPANESFCEAVCVVGGIVGGGGGSLC